MNKRDFIKTTAVGIAGITLLPGIVKSNGIKKRISGVVKFPELSYSFDALEPFISETTLKKHYLEIHRNFTGELNHALTSRYTSQENNMQILKKISRYRNLRKCAGGHLNHKMFWKVLTPNGGGQPSGRLMALIIENFGTFDNFKESFILRVLSENIDGWAWLVYKNGRLSISYTSGEDNPHMDIIHPSQQGFPILACDCHEHSYTFNYKNKKDYLENFWNFVNWNFVRNKLEKGIRNRR